MPSSLPSKNFLRLTLVTETFSPEVNGVARTLGRWVTAFQQRGHLVQVIRPRQVLEEKAPCRVMGMPIPFYPELRVGLATKSRIANLLNSFKPNLIHIATEGPLGLATLHAARQLRLPVVSSFHTNFDDYLRHYRLGWLRHLTFVYLRWFHNQSSETLAPSEGARQRLVNSGFRKVSLWPRGVDAQAFHPRFRDQGLRSSLGLGPDDLLLLYVGRLAPEKNLSPVLKAFSRLPSYFYGPAVNKLRFALVGGGPQTQHLQNMRLPGLILAGVQIGEALSRWYASADIFVFPSLCETFGNVILEAQASGLPIVAFDCPVLRERVHHGQGGLLVPPNQDLSPCLISLCRNPDLRKSLGAASRSLAEKQDWQPIFDELEKRYRRLCLNQPVAHPGVPSKSLVYL